MASPRSMWSGSITLGMLNVPVTIGKTWADEREPSLRDVCECHGLPIDRTERCSVTKEPPTGKTKGVEKADGTWHKFGPNEVEAVEQATKSDTLAIEEVRALYELPIEYGTGTYYVRFAPPKKGSTAGLDAFALLVKALGDNGAVVKWCRSATQKLAVLHVNEHGHLLLTQIPMLNEWREPDRMESAHHSVEVDPKLLKMAQKLLASKTPKSEEFDWGAYRNEGIDLRSNMVEKILGGQKLEQKQDDEKPTPGDLMQTLLGSLELSDDPDVTLDEKKVEA